MSEETNTVETEVEPTAHEIQQGAIRDMMDQWADGKLTDAQDTFNNVMGARADALVSATKDSVAANIYNDSNEQEEVEAVEDEAVETEEEPTTVEEPTEEEQADENT
tara:strand:- start:1027 stop:1347 length:321 start_codon:yes stop_codon:yes gene_type:complete